jgi:6-bladed beta-propeller protein
MRIGYVTASVGLIFASACSEGAVPEGVVVSDSAGVRIVQGASVDDLPAPLSVGEPLYRVGWAAEDPAFQRVSSGALLRDGSVAMFDEGSKTLFLLAANGTGITEVGREGEGPGEFQAGESVEVGAGDTLVVYDPRLRRLSSFDRSGRFLSSGTWDREGNVYAKPVVVTSSDRLLWVPTSYALPREMGHGTRWLLGSVMSSDLLGADPDTVATLPMLELTAEGDHIVRDPFMRWGIGAGFQDGFAWARTDVAEVRWYTESGLLRQVTRWSAEMPPVDAAAWDAYAEVYVSRAAARSREVSEDQLAEHLVEVQRGASDMLPLFGSLHSGRDGKLWLGAYTMLGSPPAEYLVFGSDGRMERRIVFQRPLRVLDLRDGRLLGIEVDEWDVQAIVVYDISTKPAA